MAKKRLGDVLRERKRITENDLEKALHEQQAGSLLLGEHLLQRGLVSKDDVVTALEEVTRFHYVDARFAKVERAVLDMIPYASAVRHTALPIAQEGRRLVCVMAEPQNLRTQDELRFVCGMEIAPRLGFASEILEAAEKFYKQREAVIGGGESKQKSFVDQVDVSEMQFATASSGEKNKQAMEEFEAELRKEKTPAVRLLSAVLASAVSKGASDIHIEPQAQDTIVRVRVDGVLRELTHVPLEMQTSLVSRVKILSDMDIAERRQPQDGRFLVQLGSRSLDLRVSTLPTHYGEKVVMRILDSAKARVSAADLGLDEEASRLLAGVLSMPQGMLLVTGPTGSGKSTTLYSCLNSMRSPAVNIVTVEDPVEYKLEAVNQVQVHAKAGLTFAACLRSILRQDPNIIMVGEIRDQETAEIALQAAQTGHIVLSTLHTNDAVSALTRLMDLQIQPFMLAASVTAIIAQRLVRKLCSCRDQVPISTEYASRLMAAGITDFEDQMYQPIGCDRCDQSGYRGRVGIYEMLVFDEQLRNTVRSGVKDEDIKKQARASGFKLMQEDALDKVKVGLTTLEEVLRVVPFDNVTSTRCSNCSKVLAPAFVYCPYCATSARHTSTSQGVTVPRRLGVNR